MDPARAIRAATADDAAVVASTVAAAFHEDPVAVWSVPDPARRPEVWAAFVEALLAGVYLPGGLVHVAEDGLGAAIWSLPETPLPQGRERDALIARVKAAWGEFAERGAALNAAARDHRPDVPHFYLSFMAVRPEGQGRGVGSALLRTMLERADRASVPAYLEATSERSAALYERHGFARETAVLLPDGPPIYPMLREPRD